MTRLIVGLVAALTLGTTVVTRATSLHPPVWLAYSCRGVDANSALLLAFLQDFGTSTNPATDSVRVAAGVPSAVSDSIYQITGNDARCSPAAQAVDSSLDTTVVNRSVYLFKLGRGFAVGDTGADMRYPSGAWRVVLLDSVYTFKRGLYVD